MKTCCLTRFPLVRLLLAPLLTLAIGQGSTLLAQPAGNEAMPDPAANVLDIFNTPDKPAEDKPAIDLNAPADPPAAAAPAPTNPYPTGGGSDAQQAVVAAYQQGMQLMQEQKYSAAIEKFHEAITIDPRFAPGLYEQGNAFAALEENDLALKSYTKAALYARRFPEVFNARGEVYLKLGQLRNAAEDFDQAVALRPTDPDFMYNRGSTYVKLGSESRSLGDMENAGKYYQNGIAALDRTIRFRPDFAPAYSDRSLARAELGQIEPALEDIEKSTQLDPTNVEYLQRLGYAYLQYANQQSLLSTVTDEMVAQYFQRAIDAFSGVLNLLQDNPEAANSGDDLAAPLPSTLSPSTDTTGPGGGLQQTKPEDILVARAVAHLRIARHVPPEDRPDHYFAAQQDCSGSLAIEPRQPAALFNQGLAYRYQEQLPEAIKSFTRALDIAPDYMEARLRRGIAWFYLGEYEMALSDFLRAGEAGNDPRPLFWAGLLTARRGNYARAVRLYSDALRGNRQYSLAYTNRGLAYLNLGQYERAIDDFNELIRLDQQDASAYYRRAVAYERLERYGQAIESYRQALEWNPDLPGANEALGHLYEELGEPEKAYQYLNRGDNDTQRPRERTARRTR